MTMRVGKTNLGFRNGFRARKYMTWKFRLSPGKFRLLPGKFRLLNFLNFMTFMELIFFRPERITVSYVRVNYNIEFRIVFFRVPKMVTRKFRPGPGKFRLLPGKFRLSFFKVLHETGSFQA